MTEASHQAMLRTPIAPTQPDDADLGVGQGARGRSAQKSGVDDLGVLVDEHERLEILAAGELVEQRVVGARRSSPSEGIA